MKRAIALLLSLIMAATCFAIPTFADTQEKIRVACVGDSITDGDMSTDRTITSYPPHLQTFLGDEYEVKNFGASGHAALKNVGFVQSYWKNAKYQASLDFNPNIVIIMLGTNDVIDPKYTDEVYKADMKALIDSYKALPSNPEIYIATAPACYTDETNKRAERIQTVLLPVQKQIAEENGCKLVDINAKTQNMKDYFADGLHPNDAGYLKFAQFMYEDVFNKTLSTVTVKTEQGNEVCHGAQQVIANENGVAEIVTGDGMKSFTVTKEGKGFVGMNVEIKGNTEIDCTGLVLPENLAINATVTDVNGAVTVATDADDATGWQSKNGFANAWLKVDFGGVKEVNSAIIEWGGSNRGKIDGYRIECSADGNSWVEVTNPVFSYGKDIDTVVFDKVAAPYMRVKVDSSAKNEVKINELGFFKTADEPFTPAVKYENEPPVSSSEEKEPEKNNGFILYILMGVGAVAIAGIAAAVTVKKQKKSNSDRNVIQ